MKLLRLSPGFVHASCVTLRKLYDLLFTYSYNHNGNDILTGIRTKRDTYKKHSICDTMLPTVLQYYFLPQTILSVLLGKCPQSRVLERNPALAQGWVAESGLLQAQVQAIPTDPHWWA
jgi:hypothetical protein